ncbi:MAG: flagellar biosynthesis anti-sigma factor FlgM [Phycisphaerales bacterium]|nr:flagellar biosynthesis anti-sigma factor FlgM [Phycisphaerales bacterium]
MTYITPSRAGSAAGIGRVRADASGTQRPQQEDIRTNPSRGSDSAELSPVSRYLSELKAGPAVRTDLVARVKSEIANGSYETDAKFEAILDDVAEDISFDL